MQMLKFVNAQIYQKTQILILFFIQMLKYCTANGLVNNTPTNIYQESRESSDFIVQAFII